MLRNRALSPVTQPPSAFETHGVITVRPSLRIETNPRESYPARPNRSSQFQSVRSCGRFLEPDGGGHGEVRCKLGRAWLMKGLNVVKVGKESPWT